MGSLAGFSIVESSIARAIRVLDPVQSVERSLWEFYRIRYSLI